MSPGVDPRPAPDAAALLAQDAAHVWHPYAPMSTGAAHLVTGAQGVHLELADGRRVVDAMSSWWCMIHGYRHPALDAALHAQVDRFAHVMFGGLTHESAVRLASRLVELAPGGLDAVFLADSGSVAVEVALKLARQVQVARASAAGRPSTRRHRFAALRGGYHGDTFGAMSVCDPVGGMHALFADALPPQVFLDRPPAGFGRPDDDPALLAWAGATREAIHAHRDELAGIVCEPILQGAGGMHVYAPGALRVLRRLADEYGLVLVLDEIATGFGRTGALFACEHAGVIPDVLTVGKALTGGYLTQSAVLTTRALAAEVDAGPGGALMHGPTFMANPLASAVSLASLDLLSTGAWRDDVARVEAGLRAGLSGLRTDPRVADVRVLGAVGVVQLHRPVDVSAATAAALDAGVWVRPFRDLVYTMPPYVSSGADVATICRGVAAAVAAQPDAGPDARRAA